MPSTLISKNVTVDGQRTSFRLEPAAWRYLSEICQRERISIHTLCSAIKRYKLPDSSLASAVRAFVMFYFHAAATDAGHAEAGHGKDRPLKAALAFAHSWGLKSAA